MDFSPTTLFVLPVSNALPTTGDTSALATSQFGVFLNTYQVATTGNIGAAPYIYLAQGRNVVLPGVGTKRSDRIVKANVVEWYKVPAIQTYSPEVYNINNFTVTCGETVTFTFRLHSSYIDTAFFNGLQKSYTVQAPCCACGTTPCTNIDVTAMLNSLVAKIQADTSKEAFYLGHYLTFQIIGTGNNISLQVTTNPLDVYGQPCDIAAFPYEYDRIWMRIFVFPGAATTQDFEVFDPCNQAATVTLLQRSTYPSGGAAEITQLEKNFYSYQAIHKHLFRNAIFNEAFQSEVVANQYYDLYVIKCTEPYERMSFGSKVAQDFTDILAVPTGQTGALETLLVDYLGAITSYVTTVPTTTSTTSTSSTSTTTTSTLEP